MYLAHEIAGIARAQGGHVTREQLRALGLSRMAIEHRVSQGSLIRVHHGVYAVGRLATTAQESAHAALLAAGPRSALARRSALALWRSARDWPAPHELVSSCDVRVKGLVVRRSQTLIVRDIRTVQGLRVTSPARTALDLAPSCSAQELTRIVDELRHGCGLSVAALRDVVARNRRHPGAGALRELIGESQREPARSELEREFMRMIRRHRLPLPRLNVYVGGERVDAYFPEHGLVVELDGRLTHGYDWRPAFEEDRRRGVDVMLRTGLPTLRFTWRQIKHQQDATAAKLRAILAARQAPLRHPG